jgi:hypothetical protein
MTWHSYDFNFQSSTSATDASNWLFDSKAIWNSTQGKLNKGVRQTCQIANSNKKNQVDKQYKHAIPEWNQFHINTAIICTLSCSAWY